MCTLLQLMVLSFASIQSELKYFNQWRPSACLQQIRSPTVWFPFYADVHTNEQSHVYTENQSTNATHHKTNKKIFCNENHFKHKFQVMQLLRQRCRITKNQYVTDSFVFNMHLYRTYLSVHVRYQFVRVTNSSYPDLVKLINSHSDNWLLFWCMHIWLF